MSLTQEVVAAAEALAPEVAVAALSAFGVVPPWLVADVAALVKQIAGAKSPAAALQQAQVGAMADAADAATDAALGLTPEQRQG